MPMRIGVAADAWRPRPAAGEARPVADWLLRTREAGFSGIEIDPLLLDEPGDLRRLLDDAGLALAAAPFAGGLLDLTLDEERRRLADVLAAVLPTGCRHLDYAETTRSIHADAAMPLVRRPQLRRDDLRRYGEKLTRLADWLTGEGMRLAFRPQIGTVVASASEIELLLASSDVSVDLTLDTGHVAAAGGDPLGLALRHAARIGHVHVLDIRPALVERARNEEWSLPRLAREGGFALPGTLADGALDPAALVRRLDDSGYRGWLVAAAGPHPTPGDPVGPAETARATLEEAVAATAARHASRAAPAIGA